MINEYCIRKVFFGGIWKLKMFWFDQIKAAMKMQRCHH